LLSGFHDKVEDVVVAVEPWPASAVHQIHGQPAMAWGLMEARKRLRWARVYEQLGDAGWGALRGKDALASFEIELAISQGDDLYRELLA
jgi:hypothetical protein